MIRHDYETHRRQISAIFQSWGMPRENAEESARVLAWADLRGVESHGIAMLVEYNERRQTRPINMASRPFVVQQTPVSRSEEHTSELQSLMRNSYAVFCLKK